jgi:glutamine amidotransferase
MKLVIIDYGSGNLHSAAKSFERCTNELGLGADIILSSKAEDILSADRIVLPGVGAYGDCRAGLEAESGLLEALSEVVLEKARPFFGICVGMQLMASKGIEHGETPGFDWIKGVVQQLEPNDPSLKLPHMGWNTLTLEKPHPVFENIEVGEDGFHAYFVHSYHLVPENSDNLIASTDYGGRVTACVGRDNMIGTQFHPEKSQTLGLKLITNFLQWSP